MAMKAVLRQLELQGKPVVAAINGHALGGGLEIALACHARFALDDPRLKIGQPEVKLGLLPGGGGTVRLPRLVGIQQALQICGEGNDLQPAEGAGHGPAHRAGQGPRRPDGQGRAPGSPPTRRPSSPGTSRSSASPAATRARRRWRRCSAIAPSMAVGQELGQLPGACSTS